MIRHVKLKIYLVTLLVNYREISDLSSETIRDISDLSDTFMTAFMDGGVAFIKFNDLSSGLHFDFGYLVTYLIMPMTFRMNYIQKQLSGQMKQL